MIDEFEAFLQSPTAQTYRRVRNAVLYGPDGRPNGLDLAELAQLYESECYFEVRRQVEEMMPLWALCPRVHFFSLLAANELGDAREVELRAFLLASCLEGVLATGDGTPSHPYLVTYSTDEYDLLQRLGLRARSQELVRGGAGRLDVIRCDDGPEIWFDVTDAVSCVGPFVERPAAVCGDDPWPRQPRRVRASD